MREQPRFADTSFTQGSDKAAPASAKGVEMICEPADFLSAPDEVAPESDVVSAESGIFVSF
jgi:hypothetical protein